ncbi:hypothetical protein F4679DRAFT_579806 [Xylaria curta]|nr:hypothetical protein F4679DRAFT_579806 [Xylaria curta]
MRISADIEIPPHLRLQIAGGCLVYQGHEFDDVSIDAYDCTRTDPGEIDAGFSPGLTRSHRSALKVAWPETTVTGRDWLFKPSLNQIIHKSAFYPRSQSHSNSQSRIINIALEAARPKIRVIRDVNLKAGGKVDGLAKAEDEADEKHDANIESRDTDADGRVGRKKIERKRLARIRIYSQKGVPTRIPAVASGARGACPSPSPSPCHGYSTPNASPRASRVRSCPARCRSTR